LHEDDAESIPPLLVFPPTPAIGAGVEQLSGRNRLGANPSVINDLDPPVLRLADTVGGRDQQVPLAFGHDLDLG